jgi:hypothetical protein
MYCKAVYDRILNHTYLFNTTTGMNDIQINKTSNLRMT